MCSYECKTKRKSYLVFCDLVRLLHLVAQQMLILVLVSLAQQYGLDAKANQSKNVQSKDSTIGGITNGVEKRLLLLQEP